MPLVTEHAFQDVPDTAYVTPEEIAGAQGSALALSVPSDTDAAALVPYFGKVALIGIEFPGFADGRGFSIAQRLRALGYTGELRARGHIIADQYPHALACGFDAVEIDDAMADRQPFAQWQAATRKVLPPYRKKKAV